MLIDYNYFLSNPHCFPKKGVIHIGAHECEEKDFYNKSGITDQNIIWIEANPDLIKPGMIQAVIDDTDNRDVDFMVTNNMQSSSILNLKDHLIMHPHVWETGRKKLTTTTLDTLFDTLKIRYDKYDFINLDIQGAELRALQGATKILPYINTVYTEVNTREIYEGCALLYEIDDFLQKHGFEQVVVKMCENFGWGDGIWTRTLKTTKDLSKV